jgi:hypothetical protein
MKITERRECVRHANAVRGGRSTILAKAHRLLPQSAGAAFALAIRAEKAHASFRMPITPFLRNQAFTPEQIEAMSLAFTNACNALGLSDRTDKLTELVASHVIEWAQRGVLDPAELTAAALKGFKGK